MQKIYDEGQMASAPPNMGKDSPIPNNVKGFNWGVFWVTPVWAIAHKSWIPLIVWIGILAASHISHVPWFKNVTILIYIVLGFFGNRWAWQNKNWKSIAEFHRIQRLWAIWSTTVVIGLVIIYTTAIFWLAVAGNKMNNDMNKLICDFDKALIGEAFKDKNFDNAETMAKTAFAYQQKYNDRAVKSNSLAIISPEAKLQGDTITADRSIKKFISKGNCAPNLKNCGVYIFAKDTAKSKSNSKLICKYYIENGGKLIEITTNAK